MMYDIDYEVLESRRMEMREWSGHFAERSMTPIEDVVFIGIMMLKEAPFSEEDGSIKSVSTHVFF